MEAHQHEGKSLPYIVVHPDGYQEGVRYPMIILLHGYGANMADLAGLAPAIHETGYVYACPNAPVPVPIGAGVMGYGWGAIGEQRTLEETQRIEEMLLAFFDEVMEQYSVSPGRVALGGFSQGGGMTIRLGLPRPDLFAGLFALSSGVGDLDEIRDRLPEQHNQPIFVAHGTEDPFLMDGRAQRSLALLEAEGYTPEYHEYAMAHEITPAVIADLTAWLQRVLPPLLLPST